MKRDLLKFSVLVLIFSIFIGCVASHKGSMSGSASLAAPNFIYKKQNVYGKAQATYFLGIGGVARQSLVFEAKKDMLEKNPLLPNQALANITVSYKSTGFLGLIITTVNCIVSADIVEFVPIQSNFTQSQNLTPEVPYNISSSVDFKADNKDNEKYLNEPIKVDDKVRSINKDNKENEIYLNESIKVGDKVRVINYFSKPVEGKVVEIKKGDYIVEYIRSDGKTKRIRVLAFQVEKIEKK